MTDLSDRLERLGLSQYLDSFISEGFDTWETLMDITESDLTYLNVKLGHRRKLQRAIAETRGQPPDRALAADTRKLPTGDGGYRSDDSGAENRDLSVAGLAGTTASAAATSNTGTKRKYRRHPKQDPHAPERPPSAYVIFSNQVREELKGQDLSFTEIAKVVGERWQVLPTEIREICEQQANSAKEKYYGELAGYKRTAEYSQYQEYLIDFKAKHGPSRSEGKRSKLESEASSASLPISQTEVAERPQAQGGSKSAPVLPVGLSRSSGPSPPNAGGFQGHAAFRLPSSSSSPVYSETINSPLKIDPYSPGASSPASSAAFTPVDHRGSRQTAPETRQRDAMNSSHYAAQSQAPFPSYRPGEPWPETGPAQPGYFTALPRRTSRGSPSIPPPLTHQDSTISSAESVPQLPVNLHLPALEGSKAGHTLTLPQPIIGQGPRQSPLDHRPAGSRSPAQRLPPLGTAIAASSHDASGSSKWPALLRATELAREADMKGGKGPRETQDEPP